MVIGIWITKTARFRVNWEKAVVQFYSWHFSCRCWFGRLSFLIDSDRGTIIPNGLHVAKYCILNLNMIRFKSLYFRTIETGFADVNEWTSHNCSRFLQIRLRKELISLQNVQCIGNNNLATQIKYSTKTLTEIPMNDIRNKISKSFAMQNDKKVIEMWRQKIHLIFRWKLFHALASIRE